MRRTTILILAGMGLVGTRANAQVNPVDEVQAFYDDPKQYNPGTATWPCPASSERQEARFQAFRNEAFPPEMEHVVAQSWALGLRRCGDPRILTWYHERIRARAREGGDLSAFWVAVDQDESPSHLAFLREIVGDESLSNATRSQAAFGYLHTGLTPTVELNRYFELLSSGLAPGAFLEGMTPKFIRFMPQEYLRGLQAIAKQRPEVVVRREVLGYVLGALRNGLVNGRTPDFQTVISAAQAFDRANPGRMSDLLRRSMEDASSR